MDWNSSILYFIVHNEAEYSAPQPNIKDLKH